MVFISIDSNGFRNFVVSGLFNWLFQFISTSLTLYSLQSYIYIYIKSTMIKGVRFIGIAKIG